MTRGPRGDDSADRIGGLYDRFAGGLYRYALMILADRSAAGDVVHDVFVAVLRRRVDMDDPEHYLRRAVRNECYGALRRRRRERVTRQDGPLLEVVGRVEDPDLRLMLEQAIRDLPPEQREVLHLKAFEGLTFQEVARITAESIDTVGSRYRYALEKLRAVLGPRM